MAERLPSLSIFFPAYNDAGSIGALVDDAYRIGGSIAREVQVIVVDDGSRDNTAVVLREAQQRYPGMQLVSHAVNRGYGAALRSALACCHGEWVFYTDGDGQYDVADLITLAAHTATADFITGYKRQRADAWYRLLFSRAFNRIAGLFFRIPVRDINCDCRLFRRALLDGVTFTQTGGLFGLELLLHVQHRGARIIEVPVRHLPRRFGHSQFFTVPGVTGALRDLWCLQRKRR